PPARSHPRRGAVPWARPLRARRATNPPRRTAFGRTTVHQDGPRQDGIPMALADDVVRGIHWLIDIEVDRCQKVLGAASEIEGEEADRAVTVGFVTQRLHDCDQLLAATTSPLACSPGVTELAPRTAAFLRELALEVRLSALEELEEWTASALGGMAWG